jgi:aminoglycoside phosphotransferase (APT) family kinase protein
MNSSNRGVSDPDAEQLTPDLAHEPVDPGLVDLPKLTAWLREQVPGPDADAPLVVRKHQAGYSNETFYVSRGGDRWVMRRPPRGELLPTAHDVLREHRVLSGLVGTGVRIPRPVAACDDPAIIGAPF